MNRNQRRLARKKSAPATPSMTSRVPALFSDAVRLHREGRLADAERQYRGVLALDARHAESLHRLGLIAYQEGRHEIAVDLIGRAIAIDPMAAAYHCNLGSALKAQGRLDQAAACYERALELNSGDTVARNNLGNVLKAQGKFTAAVACYEHVIALKPDDAEVHNNLGNALFAQGKFEGAVERYKQAIALRPNYPEVHYNLANALKELDLLDEAVEWFKRALELNPDYFEACNNLAVALASSGSLDEAVAYYERALSAKPDDAECIANLADALVTQGKLGLARFHYDRALKLKPDYLAAINGLGAALRSERRLVEAVAQFQHALTIDPRSAESHYNLALTHFDFGRDDEAIAGYHRALTLKPDYAEAHNALGLALVARGENDEAAAHYKRALVVAPNYTVAHNNLLMCLTYSDRSCEEIFSAHLRFAKAHERGSLASGVHLNDRGRARRLRVGYVSPDFKRHVTAMFMRPLLEAHDHLDVEVFCYAEIAQPDESSEQFKAMADQWLITVGMSDQTLAERIRADGIDILVDVAGHTAGNRLTMFARKPAPVQVTWLGYPNTTGLSAMDYKLVDSITDPEGEAKVWSTEALVRLDGGLLCYRPSPDFPEPAPPPCLVDGYITFGSYNNPSKFGEATLEAWAQVLARVPKSRLVLMGRCFDDENARSRIQEKFVQHGVSPDRLWLKGRTPSAAPHYASIDIALDPFPYNGTTTTCEALWMGTPVIALAGERHAGRVSASILTRVGLEDLVARDVAEYLDIAARLAADHGEIARLRRTLRSRMAASPLCDGPGFARNVERAYRQMWVRWCERAPSLPPACA
jgi:protein O-GlcNAc transferase